MRKAQPYDGYYCSNYVFLKNFQKNQKTNQQIECEKRLYNRRRKTGCGCDSRYVLRGTPDEASSATHKRKTLFTIRYFKYIINSHRISDRLNYRACEDITKINEENLLSKNRIVRVKYKPATLKMQQADVKMRIFRTVNLFHVIRNVYCLIISVGIRIIGKSPVYV